MCQISCQELMSLWWIIYCGHLYFSFLRKLFLVTINVLYWMEDFLLYWKPYICKKRNKCGCYFEVKRAYSGIALQPGGHLKPSSYCDVGRCCAVVYSKQCSFINSGWILMKLETEYLGMSKLFKYAIKSYFQKKLCVECLETFFNT